MPGSPEAMLLLTDRDGVILETVGDCSTLRKASKINLSVGGLWSEHASGTNGIGTCLAEQRPVVVWRDQHFRSTNTGLTCMGAPIFGAEGELAGVIDVSSVRLDMTEGYARLIALTLPTKPLRSTVRAREIRARSGS